MKDEAAHLRSTVGGIRNAMLIAVGCVLVFAAVGWALLLPTIVASTIRSKTGFGVRIERLSVNPFTANVELHGLLLRNPDGYPMEDFVEVREFKADAELFSLLGDRFVADEVAVDMPQLTLIKNQQGQFNALVFKDGLLGKEEPPGKKEKSKKKEFLIRHLVLKFDKLVYADYSGRRATVKEYHLKLNRELRDVTSPLQIINPLAGAFALLGGSANEVARGLFGVHGDVFKSTGETLQEAGKRTGEALKGIFETLEKRMPKK